MSTGSIAALRAKRDELLAARPPHDAMIATIVYVWQLLDSERHIGMAVGPIPWSSVMAWCDRQPYVDAELATLIAEAINHLDADRRQRENAKQQAARSPKPAPHSK